MSGRVASRSLVITVSDGVAAGVRDDESGRQLEERLSGLGFSVDRAVVPDEAERIAALVRGGAADYELIVLTGGTGLTSRDVTPQAVLPLLDYPAPGFGELMRAAGLRSTPLAALSRSFGGVLGRALVVAVPGSPRGALESLAALEPLLGHAIETLADDSSRHAKPG